MVIFLDDSLEMKNSTAICMCRRN